MGISLIHMHHFTEAQSLLREYLPIARRVLGRDHELTFGITEHLATAIAQYGDAPRENLLEAMKMHTENLRRLRQVMGAAHPETRRTEHNVKVLQECIDDAIARAHTVK